MYLPVFVKRQERSISPADADGLSVVHLHEHVGDLLLRAGILRDRIFTLGEAVHEAMRDVLKAIVSEEIEANCQTHAVTPSS